MKKISVIIPCYNSSRFLAESIDSALGQNYANIEVVVVDDGSTDDSPDIMARYGNRIRIVRQANAGLPAARNAGIQVAVGDLFAFLDSDDWWSPNFISRMVEALERSDAGIAYCGWQNVGLPEPRNRPYVPPDYEAMPDKLEKLIEGVGWPVHAALIRRDVLFGAGLFNPALKSCEDFALWIRAATAHRLVLVPEVLAFYRFHGNQMTSNRERIALSHYAVQQTFLRENPRFMDLFGAAKIRDMTSGELLKRGFIAYWERDLPASRAIFRQVMRDGYGKLRDWKYMLPALLPLSWHKRLIQFLERGPALKERPPT
jgi:glycosyltransferase involved in cell wall biosynthesis